MLNWLFGRSLRSALHSKKKVRVKGVRFLIKKVDVLNYLDGSRVMIQQYDTYKGKEKLPEPSEKKVKEHISEVICAGVLAPKISLKKQDGCFHVDDLFVDWELATGVYNEIMSFTYGKKKLNISSKAS
jgi:hypothetical protein